MARVILARHGETVWNKEGRVQGHCDSPLTSRGHMQTYRLAKRLRNESIDFLYSSDLPRAVYTSEIIRKEINLSSVQIEPDFRELCFGEFEGKIWRDLNKEYPGMLELWSVQPHKVIIPSGEKMEEASERVWKAFLRIISKHFKNNICIVSHGLVLQLLIKKIQGYPLEDWSNVPWQHNAAVNIVNVTGEGKYILDTIADYTHLQGLV